MNKFFKFLKLIVRVPRILEIKLIELYQKFISPGLGRHCKYYPTCSEYAKQAIDKYGIIKGNILAIYRIIRCNPFSHGGIDILKWNEEC